MRGKTVVITGGNAGIGFETARGVLQNGARVVLACRNPARAETARAQLSSLGEVWVVPLDLARFASVVSCAQQIQDRVQSIDVLINNAGVFLSKRVLTEDGVDKTIGVNHLGPFLLTALLGPQLWANPGGRVVNVASDAHRAALRGVDLASFTTERGPRGLEAYAQSKLANILFARELDRRWGQRGVRAYAVHPGAVASEFARKDESFGVTRAFFKVARPFLKTPKQGAQTSIHVACAEALPQPDHRYFARSRPRRPSVAARDDAAAAALWERSVSLVRDRLPAAAVDSLAGPR